MSSDLLEEFVGALDDLPDAVEHLAEIAGVLAAHAPLATLRQALSSLARSRQVEHADLDESLLTALDTLQEVLRAAANVRAGELTSTAAKDQALHVRERVMRALQDHAPARSSDLASALDLSLPQVSRALRELSERGLAVRAENPTLDGRARFYQPSPLVMRQRAPYAELAEHLGQHELDTGLFRSDMLPLGPADHVMSHVVTETRREFLRALAAAVASGRYRPASAQFFRIAKRAHASRPAALLRLPDRVVYTALASSLSPVITESVAQSVVWPRAQFETSDWERFEREPLATDSRYVVVADIAGFYDSVDHALLADSLREQGALPSRVEAMQAFLAAVMRRPYGLPQGLAASDILATAALTRVDEALDHAGICFYRHNDDYRIPVDDNAEARRVIDRLADALRDERLQLNTDKTQAVPSSAYRGNLDRRSKAEPSILEDIRRSTGFQTGQGLMGSHEGFDPERDPGLDEAGRLSSLPPMGRDPRTPPNVGPYGDTGTDWLESIDAHSRDRALTYLHTILARLEEGATSAMDALLKKQRSGWQHTAARRAFLSVLSLMAWVGRPFGDLDLWQRVLEEQPQDIRAVALYLAYLCHHDSPHLPLQVAAHALECELADADRAWLLSALMSADSEVSASLHPALFASLGQDGWLTRLAAAALLQRAGVLSTSQLEALWVHAPVALRPDLLVLLGRAERTTTVDQFVREADEVERALVGVTDQALPA